jgi:nitrite reductase/ring-hydroxylating ferredoxin subunit
MIKRITGMFVLLLLFAGCGKDDGSYIPNVLVNYHITAADFSITAKNGVMSIDNIGVAGIMIVKLTPNHYVAFDRCSSVNPEQRCKVIVDESGITATDPCSGAKFLLTDGSPQKAPAVRALKAYQVSVTGIGNGQINVSN